MHGYVLRVQTTLKSGTKTFESLRHRSSISVAGISTAVKSAIWWSVQLPDIKCWRFSPTALTVDVEGLTRMQSNNKFHNFPMIAARPTASEARTKSRVRSALCGRKFNVDFLPLWGQTLTDRKSLLSLLGASSAYERSRRGINISQSTFHRRDWRKTDSVMRSIMQQSNKPH